MQQRNQIVIIIVILAHASARLVNVSHVTLTSLAYISFLCLLCASFVNLTEDFHLPLTSQVHLNINIIIQIWFYNSYAQMYKNDLSMDGLKIVLERNSPWKDIWGRCILLASWVPFEVSLK